MTDVPPTPPLPPAPGGGPFWQSPTGRMVVWAANVLIIASTVVVLTLAARWTGVDLPVSPPPVVVQEPPPVAAVESPTQFYCGRTESITDSFSTKPWPVKQITWTVDTGGYRGGISQFQLKEAFTVAWAAWAAHIDIEPAFEADPEKALVRSRFGDIDGSGRVLAWSELADGTTSPKHQLYDAGEKWELAAVPTQIDLVRVACHEIGHALGLVHDTETSGALMAPMYDRTVRFPTARDAKRLVAMGYRPRPVPPGEKPTLPPLSITIDAAQIVEALERAGYKVQKK